MVEFDVAKPWTLIIEDESIRSPANELVRCIELLRTEAGVKQKPPLVLEAYTESALPSAYAPLVVLRYGAEKGKGFSWRLKKERLDIEGDSVRGIYNGVFDFLANLGFKWKTPSFEELPRKSGNTGNYAVNEDHGYGNSADVPSRRRLLFNKQSVKKWEEWIVWAARNRIDAVSLPLAINPAGRFFGQINKAAKKYDLVIEAGGWELSSLARHSLFLHKEMFRMTDGKRDRSVNFCPTAPETIKILQKEAKKLFLRCKNIEVYHLRADRLEEKGVSGDLKNGESNAWCSCPTCRAFTPDEQNRIAVNAVADVLLSIRPDAKISFYEPLSEKNDIAVRPNLLKISRLPEMSGVEAGGWFLAT
ncbi:MAG: hypothetical protein LBL45_00775 [Treponema sp.]|jgi:hypothetical protein|nr:hypothetical protein [Treponema sp.]